ncbi:ABC transporter ATP-binding protein [Grimontia sp. NTOU-MAR1]|uniref:ABC transporter ATP-binding protein n=1 Tax=Grimontia sp. NTOU-MAR1 TaxID=3111011 RepID=UPI002DB9F43A|nr:ATP-binding cassette domain-containing protein [Grimontia sp. NTOU-MAR1]WRW00262.1 ATP-binding cassette domain-containing protein [Grimontia sp. NTOU-MAR1]
MKPLIQLNDLSITVGDNLLIQPVSLTLYKDRPLTILGETGSGKSLLAQAIIGTLPETLSQHGDVEILDQQLEGDALKALWGKEIIMLPQEPWRSLDPLMRGYQQVSEVYECVHGNSPEAAFNMAIEDLDAVGLKESAMKRPGELSGGMAQRLAVVAAKAGGAKLILADEPTKGLDASRRDDITRLLRESAQGGGLLTITHDIEVARQLQGDIMVMRSGELLEKGTASQVLENPQHEYTKALIAADPLHWDKHTDANPFTDPVISAESLSIGRGGKALADDLSFTLHAGEVMGVVGDSGCGKSTLGDTLLGLLPAVKGSISKRTPNTAPYQWQKLFQDPPSAVTSSVTLGTLLEDLVSLHNLDRTKIPPLMDKLNLAPELLERNSLSVSGGELQRFSIMRALLLEPVFLFADEPTSRLDPITAMEVTDVLITLAKEQGCALLLVSHDKHLVEKRCDSVIKMS